MKKKLVLLLTLCMAFTFTACGSAASDTPQPDTTTEASSTENTQTASAETETATAEALVPVDVLNTIWENTDESARFACYGGNMSNPTDNAPGDFDITDTEGLTYTYLVPENLQTNITKAATLTHMMNANSFTGAAFTVTGISATDMAQAMEDAILNNQFMCGFPERLVILTNQDLVVYAFGTEDFVSSFRDIALDKYNQMEVYYDQPM